MANIDLSNVDVADLLERMGMRNVRSASGGTEMNFCVAPEARVLTRDLCWVPAGHLRVGDRLWAFDEEASEGDRRRKWRASSVTAVGRHVLPSKRFVFADGTSIEVSDDHQWLCQRWKDASEWRRSSDLKVGDVVMRLLPTWDARDDRESGYLAGIFDGEGHLLQRGGQVALQVAQNRGPVLDRIKELLNSHQWRTRAHLQHAGARRKTTCESVFIAGGLPEVMRFVGTYRPVRMIDKIDLDGVELRKIAAAKIVSIHDLGRREVVTLGTSTKTFVCEGLAAHNSCPQPGHSHGDENPSAYMNVETTAFFCWGCKWRGNALTFVEIVGQVSRATAQGMLREWYGIDFAEPRGGSMTAEIDARFAPRVEQPEPLLPSEAWLGSLSFGWGREPIGEPQKYMLDRGLSIKTLDEWEVGYDYISDRLSFPVRAVDGTLIGIKTRSWRAGQEPRYLVLGDLPGRDPRYGFAPYDPSTVVFGLHRNRREGEVVLVEGELNAMALWQLGVPRPIATGMSYFTDHHARLIISEARQVIVFYDSDKAGQEGVWGRIAGDGSREPGIVSRLEPFMPVRVIQGHLGDPLDMIAEGREGEVKHLIARAQSTVAMAL